MKYSKQIKLISIYLIIIMLLNIIIFSNKVEASSFSITTSKNELTVGDSFDITIDSTGLTGKYSITSSTNVTINGDTNPWIENASITINCTATGEGTATITVTPVTVADTNGVDQTLNPKNVSVTIKAKETTPVTPPTSGNTGTTGTPTTPTKSSEARLSNLGIKPNDFKGFKKDKYEYSVEVPNSVSKVNVYANTIKNSNAKITSGTGDVELKEGINTVKVIVTAEDGKTTKTYTLNITRKVATTDETTDEPEEENKSSEARLKNLGINPKEYDFSGFKKDNTSYDVEVPNDVEEIEVYAESVSSKAKIEGDGKVTLKEGENKIEVTVTAEDGKTTKTYILNITRSEAIITETPEEEQPEVEEKEVLGLTALSIKNINLSPKFDPEIYEYTIGLTEDLTSLDIEAKANNSNATVEIIGNEKLKNGENIITILISNSQTEENATYQIIVNKNIQKEEMVIANWLKPDTWGTRQKVTIGIVIVLIMIIIVASVMKIKLAKEEENDFDLPGADELDKALTEHQELADDEKTDIEIAQEYFESYSKRKGKHF